MRAEFLVDENGNVWFVYASEIHYRHADLKNMMSFDPKVAQEKQEAHTRA